MMQTDGEGRPRLQTPHRATSAIGLPPARPGVTEGRSNPNSESDVMLNAP